MTGRKLNWTYADENRTGDHIWWISDVRAVPSDYPEWALTYSLERTIGEIHDEMAERTPREIADAARSAIARGVGG